MELLALLQLLSAAGPAIGNVIVAIKSSNGTINPLIILDQADANIDKNKQTVNDWLASHQKKA